MMKAIRILFFLLIPLLVFNHCQKIENYPDEPQVEFLDAIVKDSIDVLDNTIKHVTLRFKIIDGDGDIGLNEGDTIGPFGRNGDYYYNLFLIEYEKIGNEFIEVTDNEFPRNYRIPDLTPAGQNKTLIANVKVEIEYGYSQSNPLRFTEFKYHFKIVDRSFNFSNTDTSALIVF